MPKKIWKEVLEAMCMPCTYVGQGAQDSFLLLAPWLQKTPKLQRVVSSSYSFFSLKSKKGTGVMDAFRSKPVASINKARVSQYSKNITDSSVKVHSNPNYLSVTVTQFTSNTIHQ